VISASIIPWGVFICIEPVRASACTELTLPTNAATFFTRATPSALLPAVAADAAGFFASPSGMVTSIGVTLPRVASGFSKAFSLPTTSTAS
jgi:hypothetical protein